MPLTFSVSIIRLLYKGGANAINIKPQLSYFSVSFNFAFNDLL
ncbi:hypothetical protein THIOSC15_620002 [uncultured Thiomicrorhabdus sp.]